MAHLDQNPNPPVEGSEYRAHTRRTGLANRVKAVVKSDVLVNLRVLFHMFTERRKHK